MPAAPQRRRDFGRKDVGARSGSELAGSLMWPTFFSIILSAVSGSRSGGTRSLRQSAATVSVRLMQTWLVGKTDADAPALGRRERRHVLPLKGLRCVPAR